MIQKHINVLFIGRGAISTELASCLPPNCSLEVIGIREKKITNTNYETMNIIKKSDIILYLGYEHRNLFLNFITLYKILKNLSFSKWKGLFIFLNTQAALDTNCYKYLNPIPEFFKYDLYRITKRIQSRVLRIFDSEISISEVYIPVVIGKGMKIEDRFEKIALHKDIYMLNFGENKIYLLDIANFSTWFWKSLINYTSGKNSRLERRFFIFDDSKSESQLINKFRVMHKLPSIQVKNYKLNYLFSNNLIQNIIWMIKKSPLGLLLYIVIGIFRKKSLADINIISDDLEAYKFNDVIFLPSDTECMSFAAEILLDKIDFKAININCDG